MERVWRALDDGSRTALTSGLAPTDLQTLLLDVARSRAGRVVPARVVRRWREDRFVRPSAHDPRALSRLEARLWELLPGRFAGVELSPVAPLGTCSAVATVDQNQVVSTVRGSEVVSDPTNALAVEAAVRRSSGPRTGRVDLACVHRVLRAQRFDGPGRSAHFRLFALVSSARDRGSGTAQAEMLADHLRFWARVLDEFVPHLGPWLTFTGFGPSALAERFADTVHPAVAGSARVVELRADPARTQGAGYYDDAAIGLRARDGEEIDLGDGGTTDWTAKLLGDAKERCVTSCVSTERLLSLSEPRDPVGRP
ncbi:hypothetical protein [Pseudonocardia humida]|uniref:Uncharacterized protein n=1 Tax=Pseudonocardia humida TaxID=2800819 RepID=A0ABT0ZZR2_9PSEU|nr:hypothetical protein [Pseudonocardia humida]MCO1656227.1 hypothetical protein [Pseudonocardia humida]